MKIGIVGMGLIGGSIARALKRVRGRYEIAAVDVSEEALALACAAGAADETGTDYKVLAGAEVVFAAVPAKSTAEVLNRLHEALGNTALLTDVASVKGEVLARLPAGIRLIGGHPMAGTEAGGFRGSKAHLFENAYYALVRTGTENGGDAALLEGIVRDMKAIPVWATAEEHDAAVSKISHLPHLAAFALCNASLTSPLARKLAAGGFKDLTRVASSPAELWTGICLMNRENVIRDVNALEEQLDLLKAMLAEGQEKHISAYFASAKEKRDGLSETGAGALARAFELYVDVADRYGAIGKITAALGRAKISIANLYVEHSREGREGVLCLRFFDAASKAAAEQALKKKHLI